MRRIGLIDIDSHARSKKWGCTIYPNLALCKISSYHKAHGDTVEWYDPLHDGRYDKVYKSKIFNFTPDYPYHIDADEVVEGGTGLSLTTRLPQEMDECQPDYSIYPSVPPDVSYGFLTRGCPNRCAWCVVPAKEGAIRPYWDIDRVANGRRKIVLMDNNFLAAGEYAHRQLDEIISKGYRIDFNQAIDARLVTPEFARQLARIKWIHNRIRLGCDTKPQIYDCEKAMDLITGNGYKGEFFLYTMLHGSLSDCYDRINHWAYKLFLYRETHGLEGYNAYPFAQPYRDPFGKNAVPQWQKDMAQWCNKKNDILVHGLQEFPTTERFSMR